MGRFLPYFTLGHDTNLGCPPWHCADCGDHLSMYIYHPCLNGRLDWCAEEGGNSCFRKGWKKLWKADCTELQKLVERRLARTWGHDFGCLLRTFIWTCSTWERKELLMSCCCCYVMMQRCFGRDKIIKRVSGAGVTAEFIRREDWLWILLQREALHHYSTPSA